MSAKKALGKGLGSIFGRDDLEEEVIHKKNTDKTISDNKLSSVSNKRSKEITNKEETYIKKNKLINTESDKDENVSRETLIKISLIEPNKTQPRKIFDEEPLKELAESIKKYGILQPLIVKKNGIMYEIIAGERRWRAAKLAGLTEVPVIIRDFEKQEAAEIAIIENIQREDLGAVEEARAYQALINEFGLTQEEVANKVFKNRTTITNSIRLLSLCDEVLKLLEENKITAGHARCLVTIEDPEVQLSIANEIISKKLSVRNTEKLVKSIGKNKTDSKSEAEQELDMYLIDIARKLTGELGTKVQIKQGVKGKGKIEIDYYSEDDLNKIIEKLR
ncbi:MAG: ParB/RepB/Spo0J family partition protein [Eubacteriales bacterium]|nr:ParB/RepB/Spo0J family partition protein [Eubacteriales bacterium]